MWGINYAMLQEYFDQVPEKKRKFTTINLEDEVLAKIAKKKSNYKYMPNGNARGRPRKPDHLLMHKRVPVPRY